MIDWFINLNYITQAFIATIFTLGVTALGSAIVFFFKKVNKTLLDSMLGFAAGVMIAASFWSLLNPAIDMSNKLNMISYVVVSFGFICGGILLFLGDKLFEKLNSNISKSKRSLMLILSITLHNIPEGLVIGVAFGS